MCKTHSSKKKGIAGNLFLFPLGLGLVFFVVLFASHAYEA